MSKEQDKSEWRPMMKDALREMVDAQRDWANAKTPSDDQKKSLYTTQKRMLNFVNRLGDEDQKQIANKLDKELWEKIKTYEKSPGAATKADAAWAMMDFTKETDRSMGLGLVKAKVQEKSLAKTQSMERDI